MSKGTPKTMSQAIEGAVQDFLAQKFSVGNLLHQKPMQLWANLGFIGPFSLLESEAIAECVLNEPGFQQDLVDLLTQKISKDEFMYRLGVMSQNVLETVRESERMQREGV